MMHYLFAILVVVLAVLAPLSNAAYAPTGGPYIPDGESEYGAWININNEPDYLRIWQLRDSQGVYKFWVGFATGTESAMKVYKEPVVAAPSSSSVSASASATVDASSQSASATLVPVRRRWEEDVYLNARDVADVGIGSAIGDYYWPVELLQPKPEDGLMFFWYNVTEFGVPEGVVFGFSALSDPLSFVSGADYTTYDAENKAIIAFIPFADMPVSQFAVALFSNTTFPRTATPTTTTTVGGGNGGNGGGATTTTAAPGGTTTAGATTTTTFGTSTFSSVRSTTATLTSSTTQVATTTSAASVNFNTAASRVALMLSIVVGYMMF